MPLHGDGGGRMVCVRLPWLQCIDGDQDPPPEITTYGRSARPRGTLSHGTSLRSRDLAARPARNSRAKCKRRGADDRDERRKL